MHVWEGGTGRLCVRGRKTQGDEKLCVWEGGRGRLCERGREGGRGGLFAREGGRGRDEKLVHLAARRC